MNSGLKSRRHPDEMAFTGALWPSGRFRARRRDVARSLFFDTCCTFRVTYFTMTRNENAQPQITVADPVRRGWVAGPARRKPATQRDEASLAAIRDARRILVLGSSGSGKTHLSGCLAETLGLEVIHLDAHFWRSDSQPRADEEWRKIVSELSQREAWIMDGTYERSLDLRIPRADAIILLELAPAHCLARVIERQMSAKNEARPDLPDGFIERLNEDHRRYVLRYPEVTRPAVLASIERHGPDTPVVTLAAPEEIDPFVTQLRQTVSARNRAGYAGVSTPREGGVTARAS